MYTQNKTLKINSTPIQNNNKLQMNLHELGLEETGEPVSQTYGLLG